MNEIKILSDRFRSLDSLINGEKQNYSKASPYPHIVIKDFFDEKFLNEVLEFFPDLSKKSLFFFLNILIERFSNQL